MTQSVIYKIQDVRFARDSVDKSRREQQAFVGIWYDIYLPVPTQGHFEVNVFVYPPV